MDFLVKLRTLLQSLSHTAPGTIMVVNGQPPPSIAARIPCTLGGTLHCDKHPIGQCCWCEYMRAGTN